MSIKHGAAIVLIGEELGKQPMRLAPVIAENRITVWYSTPSILQLKKYCATALPAYMAPDRFKFLPALPKTSTEKVDYQKLKETA